MKLWLISQDTETGYDTYDSAVVAAETSEDAGNTYPNDHSIPAKWPQEVDEFPDWCPAIHVRAVYLGEACEGTTAGVILASFNAG